MAKIDDLAAQRAAREPGGLGPASDVERMTTTPIVASSRSETSLVALYELSPDVRLEELYRITQAPHGHMGVYHWFGTNAEGGAFESIFVVLRLWHGERLVGVESFDSRTSTWPSRGSRSRLPSGQYDPHVP